MREKRAFLETSRAQRICDDLASRLLLEMSAADELAFAREEQDAGYIADATAHHDKAHAAVRATLTRAKIADDDARHLLRVALAALSWDAPLSQWGY